MKKTLLLLVFALLLPAFAACSGDAGDAVTNVSETSGQTETTTAAETRDPLLDDLGEFDFKGYEFRVVSAQYDPAGTFVLFDTPEQTGEVLVDSLYTRNREIEDRFNIVFKAAEDSYDNNFRNLTKLATSGDDAYDLMMLINRNAFTSAVAGHLMPVSKLTYLDLDKDYYLHDINEMFTIKGKMFLAYSEESVYTFERSCIVAFNKKLAADYKLPDMYKLTSEGGWTMDKMFTYASTATKDLDGDGKLTDADQWGINGHKDYVFPSYWIAADEQSVKKDKNDIPYFNAYTSEKFSTIVATLISTLNSGKVFNCSSSYEAANKQFADGNVLFLGTCVGRLFALRDMEEDFGMLLFPKYDEKQNGYYTRACDAWLHVVPVTNKDPERTSVILEALASGSARYVFPAYYDKAVSQKVLRDDESVEILDLIRSTRTVDMGECPWYETIRRDLVDKVIVNQSAQLASFNESINNMVQKLITETVEAADKLD